MSFRFRLANKTIGTSVFDQFPDLFLEYPTCFSLRFVAVQCQACASGFQLLQWTQLAKNFPVVSRGHQELYRQIHGPPTRVVHNLVVELLNLWRDDRKSATGSTSRLSENLAICAQFCESTISVLNPF